MTTVGLIYKIINEDTPNEVCYIGSTCKTLKQRLKLHNNSATAIHHRNYNIRLYIHMREFGQHKFKIHLVEAVEFEYKSSLLEREKHWINTLNPTLNIVRNPISSEEERKAYVKTWFNENKAHVVEYKKQLYIKDKASIQEKRRNTPMVSCPCSTKQFKEYNRSIHVKCKTHRAWLLLQV